MNPGGTRAWTGAPGGLHLGGWGWHAPAPRVSPIPTGAGPRMFARPSRTDAALHTVAPPGWGEPGPVGGPVWELTLAAALERGHDPEVEFSASLWAPRQGAGDKELVGKPVGGGRSPQQRPHTGLQFVFVIRHVFISEEGEILKCIIVKTFVF